MAEMPPRFGMDLSPELVKTLVRLPLSSIQREYPNKLDHVIRDREDLRSPRDLHPAFYGSFDWHSAVHGHWALVRLLKRFLVDDENAVRFVLREHLSQENLAAEAAYLDEPGRLGFERPYGWTWLLKLVQELHDWDDADGRLWREWIRPLEERIVARYIEFLPKQTYPIRVGTHGSTAFGLLFAIDYARCVDNKALAAMLVSAASRYFASDRRLPMEWEPGGADFLSPSLVEADLMRRVLGPMPFNLWLDRCMGGRLPANLQTPAVVSDRTDGQISHLDGLNLSRAWNMCGIASVVQTGSALRSELMFAADVCLAAGLEGLEGSTYEGDHWLGSFALLALTE